MTTSEEGSFMSVSRSQKDGTGVESGPDGTFSPSSHINNWCLPYQLSHWLANTLITVVQYAKNLDRRVASGFWILD
jgi:hypothetical protein